MAKTVGPLKTVNGQSESETADQYSPLGALEVDAGEVGGGFGRADEDDAGVGHGRCGGTGKTGRVGQRQCLKRTRGQWLKRSTRLAAPNALPPLSASSTAALSSPGGNAPASSEVAISV
jgi:hypothetical protein